MSFSPAPQKIFRDLTNTPHYLLLLVHRTSFLSVPLGLIEFALLSTRQTIEEPGAGLSLRMLYFCDNSGN